MAAKRKSVSKSTQVQASDTEAVVEKVAALKSPVVIQSFSDLKVKVQTELDKLSAEVSEGVRQRDEVKTAIAALEARLQELYGVEREMLSLDEVKQQRLAEEAAYQAEVEARDAERVREDNEYAYNLTRKRREELDKYNDQLAAQKRENERSQRTLQEEWDAREEALTDREQELEDLRAQVAAHPEVVSKEVKRAEAILSSTLSRNFEHEKALLMKDKANAESLAAQRIASLEAELANAKAHAAAVSQDLAAARTDLREIASKTVEAASGQQALAAIQSSLATQNLGGKTGGR